MTYNNPQIKRIEINNGDTLLGCRWYIGDGRLKSLPEDLFDNNTEYFYLEKNVSAEDFDADVKRVLLEAESDSLNNAQVSVECVYMPTLQCGDKLLALNTVDNKFIVDRHFASGYMTLQNVSPVRLQEESINPQECRISPVDLSRKEADFLVGNYGLPTEEKYRIVFVPVYQAKIVNDKNTFYITKPACDKRSEVANNLYKANSVLFYTLLKVMLFTACIGCVACLAYYLMAEFNFDAKQILNCFLDNTLGKGLNVVSEWDLMDKFNDFVPVLGLIVGLIVEIALLIACFIIFLGLLPAFCLGAPVLICEFIADVVDNLRNRCNGIRLYKKYRMLLNARA